MPQKSVSNWWSKEHTWHSFAMLLQDAVYRQDPDGTVMPLITHALAMEKKESKESLRGAAWLYRHGMLHTEIPQCGRHPFV